MNEKPIRCAIVVLNYATARLTVECLESLIPELEELDDVQVVVVDNNSPDDSALIIEHAIESQGMGEVGAPRTLREEHGIRRRQQHRHQCRQRPRPTSCSTATPSSGPARSGTLLDASDRFPDAGIIGPLLEWPDEEPQESAFRFRTPRTEMLGAAGTGPVTRMFGGTLVAIEPRDTPFEAQWISFACALIRREVIDRVGMLDDAYFMYFEDADYCRRARRQGFRILCWPDARVVHLRGGTSNVKEETEKRGRRPEYYYESRARYFATFYGRRGYWITNLLWGLGKLVAIARETVGNKSSHACEREWRDNWMNWRDPLRRKAA